MAASGARGLGPLRFVLDGAFADETVYMYGSADDQGSICVELEPLRDPPADAPALRLARAAAELGRVYDDARLEPPASLATGAGEALVMRARMLDDVQLGAAAVTLEPEGLLVYLTATAEARPLAELPVVVESLRRLDTSLPPPPPGFRWTAAGVVALCVPAGWTEPAQARFRCRSALVVVSAGAPADTDAPEDLVAIGRGERLVLDGKQPPDLLARDGWQLATTVATYSVVSAQGAPVDAVMVRATTVAAADGRVVASLVGAARSAEWPLLIAGWAPLVAAIREAG